MTTDRGVRAHVGQQVGEHLPDPALVGQGGQVLRSLERQRPFRLHGPGVGDRVAGEGGQVDVLSRQRGALVETGQLQQLFDQPPHPLRLRRDPAHRLVGVDRALLVQLGVAADGRQRGAQLV
jgi:hypothetical protein